MRNGTRFAILLAALMPTMSAYGGDSSGGGPYWDWQTSSKFPKETHNPDEKEQKRLRVRWDKAAVGHRTFRSETPNYHWVKGDELMSSSGVIISGTLLLESEDGKSSKPIDWFQGVRVLIAREPRSHPELSKPNDRDSVESGDCLIEKDGKFEAFIDADRIRRSVARLEEFQVGLSLATKSDQTVRWYNTTPALPQSVTMLSIAGPRALSSTLTIINASPSITVAVHLIPWHWCEPSIAFTVWARIKQLRSCASF